MDAPLARQKMQPSSAKRREPERFLHARYSFLQVAFDKRCRQAQGDETSPEELVFSAAVSGDVSGVVSVPIHFDDEPRRRSHEVHDALTDDDLAPKLDAELLGPKARPKERFGRSGMKAHSMSPTLKKKLTSESWSAEEGHRRRPFHPPRRRAWTPTGAGCVTA